MFAEAKAFEMIGDFFDLGSLRGHGHYDFIFLTRVGLASLDPVPEEIEVCFALLFLFFARLAFAFAELAKGRLCPNQPLSVLKAILFEPHVPLSLKRLERWQLPVLCHALPYAWLQLRGVLWRHCGGSLSCLRRPD